MIREFVQHESKKDGELYRGPYIRAVSNLHTFVGLVPESNGDSIADPPHSCNKSVSVLSPHSSKVPMSFFKKRISRKGFQSLKEALKPFFFTSRALISQGRTVDVPPLCNAQYEVLSVVLGNSSNDDRVLSTLSNLSLVARKNGNLNDATGKYFKSLRKLQEVHGPDVYHADVAAALHNMGAVAQERGRLNEADRRYRESYDMFTNIR